MTHEYTNQDIPSVPRGARTLREKLIKSAGFSYSEEAEKHYNRMVVDNERIERLVREIVSKRHEIVFLRGLTALLIVLLLVAVSNLLHRG